MSNKLLFFILLVTLSLGTRFLIYQFTPGFHEYEAISIYLSDILLLAITVVFLMRFRQAVRATVYKWSGFIFAAIPNKIAAYGLIAFLVAAGLSIILSLSPGLAVYNFIRLMLLAVFALAVGKIVFEKRIFEKVLLILAILAVVQSLFGILQFKTQSNLGLEILGESPVGSNNTETSRVAVGSARLMRAYGTFPHPNILAAFLLFGLFGLFHFYFHLTGLKEYQGTAASYFGSNFYKRSALAAGIFLVSIALILTFSRAAWLTGFLGTLPFIIYALYKETRAAKSLSAVPSARLSKFWFQEKPQKPREQIEIVRRSASLRLLVGLLMINYLLFAILGWAIFPRVHVFSTEASVLDRVSYNKMALEIVKRHPLGVGIGNQVLYSYKSGLYEEFDLGQRWQWQPIHNLYLLIASEIGFLGLLGFLVFVFIIIRAILKGGLPLEKITILTLLGSVLILGLFDHFFWTIEQGRLMLWLTLGLTLSVTRFKPEIARPEDQESAPS